MQLGQQHLKPLTWVPVPRHKVRLPSKSTSTLLPHLYIHLVVQQQQTLGKFGINIRVVVPSKGDIETNCSIDIHFTSRTTFSTNNLEHHSLPCTPPHTSSHTLSTQFHSHDRFWLDLSIGILFNSSVTHFCYHYPLQSRASSGQHAFHHVCSSSRLRWLRCSSSGTSKQARRNRCSTLHITGQQANSTNCS